MTAESIFERELTHWVVRGVVELAMMSPLQEPILEGVDAAGFGDQIEPVDDDTSVPIDVGEDDSDSIVGEGDSASTAGEDDSSFSTDESTPPAGDPAEADADSDEHSDRSTWSKFRQGVTVFVVLFVVLYLFLRWTTKDDE